MSSVPIDTEIIGCDMPLVEEMRNHYFNRCKNTSLIDKRREKVVIRDNIDDKIKKVNKEAINSIDSIRKMIAVTDQKMKNTVG